MKAPHENETGEVSGEPQYAPLSEEALKKLALGVIHNQVFGSWMIGEHDPTIAGMIFLPLALMTDIQRKEMRRDKIVHLYEWYDKAGPRSVNGYPCFFSFHSLNAADCERLTAKIKAIEELLETI